MVFIIVFYDLKKGHIINFGSSEIGHHPICANIHAEEVALLKLNHYFKYKNLKSKYKKNIILYIWKNNSKNNMFPAFTCSWCAGIIRKYKFPINNVITLKGKHSYTENHKEPLKLTDICNHK